MHDICLRGLNRRAAQLLRHHDPRDCVALPPKSGVVLNDGQIHRYEHQSASAGNPLRRVAAAGVKAPLTIPHHRPGRRAQRPQAGAHPHSTAGPALLNVSAPAPARESPRGRRRRIPDGPGHARPAPGSRAPTESPTALHVQHALLPVSIAMTKPRLNHHPGRLRHRHRGVNIQPAKGGQFSTGADRWHGEKPPQTTKRELPTCAAWWAARRSTVAQPPGSVATRHTPRPVATERGPGCLLHARLLSGGGRTSPTTGAVPSCSTISCAGVDLAARLRYGRP